jgi:sec-independent protein translocase protein TatA
MVAIFDSPESWLYVAVIVAVLFGSSKLPEIARSIGRSKGEFQKGLDEGKSDEPDGGGDAKDTRDA